MNSSTPYSGLNPNLILEAIESVGFQCNGSLFALNSFENRVYQVGIEDSSPLIAKFYRPARWSDETILEEHQFALELANLEIPVVAPWLSDKNASLHSYKDFRFALFPRVSGRPLELDSFEQLEWMGRFIGRLHAVGACRPFQHRPSLTVQTHGYSAFNFLIEHNFIPAYLKTDYCKTVEQLLLKIEKCFQQAGSINYIRLHGDIHAGNVLWNDTGPHIVDLDDCIMGPAIQDIWMLLSGNDKDARLELDFILEGYREFHDFNNRELYLIEALRSLRLLQYSAWVASRWEDPAFPKSFPWFNTHHYWEEQVGILKDQIHALDNKLYLNVF